MHEKSIESPIGKNREDKLLMEKGCLEEGNLSGKAGTQINLTQNLVLKYFPKNKTPFLLITNWEE